MKPDYKETGNSRLGGVYKIINLKNGRVYYGSTLAFRKRYLGHHYSLENNRHANRFLQSDYNKTGSEHFVFEVVEVVAGTKEDLYKEEQKYLDLAYDNGKQCYNLKSVAGNSRAGSPDKEKSCHDKRRQPPSEEARNKRKASLEKYYAEEYSEEDREKRRERTKKYYIEHNKYSGLVLTHEPTGEQVELQVPLRTFCDERGLSYKAMHQLVRGKIKSSGGWFVGTEKPVYVERKGEKRKPLSEETKRTLGTGKYEGIVLVNDRGETLTIARNIKQQARELGLYYTTLMKVIHRETKSVGGWKLPPSASSSAVSQPLSPSEILSV
jgi:group I intron endonuclease